VQACKFRLAAAEKCAVVATFPGGVAVAGRFGSFPFSGICRRLDPAKVPALIRLAVIFLIFSFLAS